MAIYRRVYDYPGRSISSDPSLHIPPRQISTVHNRLVSKRNRKRFGG
jgi:hypothetical protein